MKTETIYKMLRLQGKIRMRLMQAGISEEQSRDLAADIGDIVFRSSVATEEVRKEYQALQDKKNTEAS